MSCNKKCRRNVRVQLATFAAINYMLGMGTFMFFLCSSSPEHLDHLGSLLTDPITFVTTVTDEMSGSHSHH